MLSVCQCLTQILNMRIMWGRDVDNVYIRIGKDIFKAIIYLGNLVFFRECYCFSCVRFATEYRWRFCLASAVASSFAMTPQPRVAQFNGFIDKFLLICIYTPFYALILA